MKVREVMVLIEADGWYLVRTRGDHHRYKHPTRKGLVTVAGHPWHAQQYHEASRAERGYLMKYAVVIEQVEGNYSAYVPDLPGCVATGDTVEDVERVIRDAIVFHIAGLQAEGLPVPEPTTRCAYVEAACAAR